LSYWNNSNICSITFILVVDTEGVVKKALEELKNNQLIPDYAKHEKRITDVLQAAAQKETKLTTQMLHMIDNKTMREVEKEMSAIIGHERVDLIKKSFAIETYRMKVVKMPDGQSALHVHRKGVEFQPERMLMSINDIETATVLQWASLVVELFLFVLSCVGIGVDLSEAEMRILVQEVEGLVREPPFQRVLNKFLEVWNEVGGSVWGKAKAIFYFLKDSFSLGIFWKIIKLIFQNMSTWEKIRAMAEVSLMIVAAFATEGIALIARIALAVDSAVYLAEKIANLATFSDMKKTMK
jgi:hypothetical protein